MYRGTALAFIFILLSACASLDSKLAQYGAGAYQLDNTTIISKDGKVLFNQTITEKAHCDQDSTLTGVLSQCHHDSFEVK